MPIIAIVGNKGGAGKTTLSVNLASGMAKQASIAVLDADPRIALGQGCRRHSNHPEAPVGRLQVGAFVADVRDAGDFSRNLGPGALQEGTDRNPTGPEDARLACAGEGAGLLTLPGAVAATATGTIPGAGSSTMGFVASGPPPRSPLRLALCPLLLCSLSIGGV